MSISVLLVDDHQVILDGLAALLAREADLTVVAATTDPLEVFTLIERHDADVLVVDLMMAGMHGLEVVRQVARRAPRTRSVVLSMHNDDAYVAEAMRNGALGYVLKQAAAPCVVEAIRAAARNQRFLSPPLTLARVEQREAQSRGGTVEPFDTLTTREREVIKLIAEGQTSAAIGKLLHIGKRTVETHRANAHDKLGLANQAQLIRFALKRGLID